MNQLKLYGRLLCTATTLLLFSCGNSEDKTTTTESTGDTTVTTSAETAPVNTVVTTPENIFTVVHTVVDYDKWLAGFESADSMKLAYGLHNYVVGRSVENPNKLLVATKADDVAKAKEFSKSADLKKGMKEHGVTGTPTMAYMTTVYQDTANVNTDLRARTMLTVKDFDTWRTSFESHRQERLDAGLVDRVYGYDPDNKNKVTIVVAVMDTAKANAFWNSDGLKQRMEQSGVTGKPDRFVFRISKRY
jgi:hypothetical protein